MTRTAASALSLGVLLFIGVLASQGLPAIIGTLALAGWGLLLVALFPSSAAGPRRGGDPGAFRDRRRGSGVDARCVAGAMGRRIRQ